MKIYRNIKEFIPPPYPVVTVGFFDGVHKGHQSILKKMLSIAEYRHGNTVVVTFWPHPRLVLKNSEEFSIQLLNTFEEKISLLREQGVEHLLCLPFTQAFAKKTPKQYIEDILIKKLGIKELVIGYNHRFGKNRAGGLLELKEYSAVYGFEVEEILQKNVDGIKISSSQIRTTIREGDMHKAQLLLGRPYSLSGHVVEGDKLGRKIGFPTANLNISFAHKLIPKDGIYAVLVEHKEIRYQGMLYIGCRPTVSNTSQSIEVNIFDFNQNIYGDNIKIDIIALIREDILFKDIASMQARMQEDKNVSLRILKEK